MSHCHRKPSAWAAASGFWYLKPEPWAISDLSDGLWRPQLPMAQLGRLKALSLSQHNTIGYVVYIYIRMMWCRYCYKDCGWNLLRVEGIIPPLASFGKQRWRHRERRWITCHHIRLLKDYVLTGSLVHSLPYGTPRHQQIVILLIGFSLLFDLLPTNKNSKSWKVQKPSTFRV